jgi:hypothetical protein
MKACSKCNKAIVSPVITKCGHIFCYDCLKESSRNESKCPKCHSKINFEESVPIYGHGDQKANLKSQKNISTQQLTETDLQESNVDSEYMFYPGFDYIQTSVQINKFNLHPLVPLIAVVIIIFHGVFLA